MTILLYGIPNCDQVKRARAWFGARGLAVEFIDYRRTPPTAALVERWLTQVDVSRLVNRAGATWRRLDHAQRARADTPGGAVALMVAHPSLIRRPVVEHDGALLVGFDADGYSRTFHE